MRIAFLLEEYIFNYPHVLPSHPILGLDCNRCEVFNPLLIGKNPPAIDPYHAIIHIQRSSLDKFSLYLSGI